MLAGVNGAGKSSVLGAALRTNDAPWFDPDAAARLLRESDPGLTLDEANSGAWQEGLRLLDRAIEERKDFTFETTLGGRTITGRLEKAAEAGFEIRISYVGLEGADLHVSRVRARAARGGHDIPEELIRHRYDTSRGNLVRLLPRVAELRVWDNTLEGDPASGVPPSPRLILHVRARRILSQCALAEVPEWAKPVVQAAIEESARRRR